MKGFEVVRTSALGKKQRTTGMVREVAFESEAILFARSRMPGGNVSGWHHHGKREVYGFIVSGRLRIDFGPGKKSVEIREGDSFHIPVGLIHRDVNPDPDHEAQVVNLMLGKGPPVVNVSEP